MRRVLVTVALVVLITLGAGARAIDRAAAGTGASAVQSDSISDAGHDSSPPYVMIILTTVFVAGGCLYLLFRRGSIAYRAREDDEPPSKS